jgi:hypothetical protein
MAYKIKVEQRGKKPKDFLKDVQKKVKAIQQAQDELGQDAADYMAQIIMSSTKREPSTGRLAKSIYKTTTFSDVQSITGVGDKKMLPPYWYVVNYGAKQDGTPFIPGAGQIVPGHFDGEGPDPAYAGVPGGAGIRFIKGGRIKTAVKATHPIEPMNYIEQTKAWMDVQWKQYVQSRTRSISI